MKDINLIPKRVKLKKKKKRERLYFIIVGIFIIAFFVYGTAIPIWIKATMNSEKDKIEANTKAMSNYSDIENQLTYVKGMFQQRVDESAKLDKNGIDIVKLYEELERAATQKIFFTSLNANEIMSNNTQVNLSGTAETEDDLATFTAYMRKSSLCDSINITSVKRVEKTGNPGGGNNTALGKDTSVPEKSIEVRAYYVFDITIYLKAGK